MKLRIIGLSAVAATAILAGCGGGPGSMTARGTVEVFANPLNGSTVQNAFPDITPGGTVTVVDSSGKVIGTGTLAPDVAVLPRRTRHGLPRRAPRPGRRDWPSS